MFAHSSTEDSLDDASLDELEASALDSSLDSSLDSLDGSDVSLNVVSRKQSRSGSSSQLSLLELDDGSELASDEPLDGVELLSELLVAELLEVVELSLELTSDELEVVELSLELTSDELLVTELLEVVELELSSELSSELLSSELLVGSHDGTSVNDSGAVVQVWDCRPSTNGSSAQQSCGVMTSNE